MAGDIWAACSRFCHSYLCQVFWAFGAAGLSVAGTVWLFSLEIDRMARETKTVTMSNTQAIDALTAEVRKTSEAVHQVSEDVAYLRGRSQARSTPRGPLVLAMPAQGLE